MWAQFDHKNLKEGTLILAHQFNSNTLKLIIKLFGGFIYCSLHLLKLNCIKTFFFNLLFIIYSSVLIF